MRHLISRIGLTIFKKDCRIVHCASPLIFEKMFFLDNEIMVIISFFPFGSLNLNVNLKRPISKEGKIAYHL